MGIGIRVFNYLFEGKANATSEIHHTVPRAEFGNSDVGSNVTGFGR